MRKSGWGLIAVLLLLILWKMASAAIDAVIILPPPEQVAASLLRKLADREFWPAVGATAWRGLKGFMISLILGTITGLAAGRYHKVYQFMNPLLAVIRTTPVMSVILLAMIWFKTGDVPVFTAFLMAYPIITGNIITGMRNRNPDLDEMAKIYGFSRKDTLLHISIPSILPYLTAGIHAAVGLTWKVVIAAEILAQPIRAMGTGMKYAQASLETVEVLAWTAAAIILSYLSETLVYLCMEVPLKRRGRGSL